MGEDDLEWPPDPMGERPKVSASRRAYEHVKERILDGRLPGTWLLSENDVAQELGVSRTPVRTAFGQLEAEGYLTLYPKRGAVVTPISPREAEEVIEARWVIERHALEQASPQLGAELAALADPGEKDFVEADRAFHRALVAGTGNEILLGLYDTLRDRQRRMLRVGSRTDERKATITAEHRELAQAIADGEDATGILRRHLDGALAALRGR
ncbi:GntR family transcriptional regulator [Solirubrobacter soli]|uniref:GntR family transcriptional regulator n=1 Tax=Solirubrobacter soli TaxID=363832 RepID=UPI00069E42AB|nr:GntR family transcriptional regulator [Solirubrobacter soli]